MTMNNWNEFLNRQMVDKTPSDFVQSVIPDLATYLVALKHHGLLTVEGPDAAKFLQGQVTCDLRELDNQTTRLGAQCTLKGRMLVSFRALQLDAERVFLRMPSGLVEKAMATFGKYIVFSKAKLHDRRDNYCCIGLYGPHAETLIGQIFGANPGVQDAWLNDTWCNLEGNVIIKLDHQRYECWLTPDQAQKNWLALEAAGCEIAGENLWTLLDIRAGIGEVRPETSETFTPQALNYQLVNGINFRKGCYTGQEIVARLHYRGTLKQHMYRLGVALPEGVSLPAPGSAVVNAEQRNIGEIVLAAHSGPGTAEVLAVVNDAHLGEAYLPANPPQKLEQLALPYAIPSEEKS